MSINKNIFRFSQKLENLILSREKLCEKSVSLIQIQQNKINCLHFSYELMTVCFFTESLQST